MLMAQQGQSYDFKMVNRVFSTPCMNTGTGLPTTRPQQLLLRRGPSHVPRHTAGRRAVHLPRSVQVHVDRPVGGDAHRLRGLHVRRGDAPGPREPSSLRHSGGWSFQSGLVRGNPAVVRLLRARVLLFRVPQFSVSFAAQCVCRSRV